jgi:hypothetical protein
MASCRCEAEGFRSQAAARRCAGRKLANAVDGVIGKMSQHMAQPGFGIGPVQLHRADQRVNRGGTFAIAVGACKQVVAKTDGHAAQYALGRRVIDLRAAIPAVVC